MWVWHRHIYIQTFHFTLYGFTPCLYFCTSFTLFPIFHLLYTASGLPLFLFHIQFNYSIFILFKSPWNPFLQSYDTLLLSTHTPTHKHAHTRTYTPLYTYSLHGKNIWKICFSQSDLFYLMWHHDLIFIYISHFPYLSVDGHLGQWYFLDIMIRALWTYKLLSLLITHFF